MNVKNMFGKTRNVCGSAMQMLLS